MHQCTQCGREWPTNYCPECGCTIDRTLLEHTGKPDQPRDEKHDGGKSREADGSAAGAAAPDETSADSRGAAARSGPRPVKYRSVPIVSMERLDLGVFVRMRTRYRISDVQSHEIAYRFRDAMSLRRPLRNWLTTPVFLLVSVIIAAFPTVCLLSWLKHERGDLPPTLVFLVLGAISTVLFLCVWYAEGRRLLILEKAKYDREIDSKGLRLKLVPERKWNRFRSSLR